MPGNSTGRLLRLVSFGESHGAAIGGVLDGFPPGIVIDTAFIQNEMDKRKPGTGTYTSGRREQDQIEILSGVFQGVSLGTPIAFMVRNTDARPGDYETLRTVYRPSHADFTYEAKYGIRDYRGGGRSSARETLVRVAAGAFAKLFLATRHIFIQGYTSAIGPIEADPELCMQKAGEAAFNDLRCPDSEAVPRMREYLDSLQTAGDSCGGVVNCTIHGVPAGLGEPVYDKTEALLAHAMLSINASMGFEFGSGFKAATLRGSENNDQWELPKDAADHFHLNTRSNNSGGIQGGITNGQPIRFRVAFKPVASIRQKQDTFDNQGNPVSIEVHGRHDVCIVPRAVAVVEAMAALVIADLFLQHKAIDK